jgi:IS5 family transposase
MSNICRFTSKAVQLVKNVVAEYAVESLHCFRVFLEKSYREALDLLSEMPHILGEIGLEPADLSHHSMLVEWFDRIKTIL